MLLRHKLQRPVDLGRLSHHRARGGSVAGRILANDLLECHRQDLPREDLDVLFDIPRLRIGEAHDNLEEVLTVRLALGHCERLEALEVPSNTILLFDSEASSNERFQKQDRVDARDKCLFLLLPPDAVDGAGVIFPFVLTDHLEAGMDVIALLLPLEDDDLTHCRQFLLRPDIGHFVEVTLEMESSFAVR